MRPKRTIIGLALAAALLGALSALFLRAPSPAFAANYLFLNDIPVTLTGFAGPSLKILAGSKADLLTLQSTSLTVTVASGETFTLRYPGPDPGVLVSGASGVPSCNLTGGNNDVTVSGPRTVTFSPSTAETCSAPAPSSAPPQSASQAATSIVVSSPNGGEVLQPGANPLILWGTSGGTLDFTVRISLSTDGGATYPTVIATGVSGLSGAYGGWTVPALQTTMARIKVEAISGSSASDVSDAHFTIATPVVPDAAAPAAVTDLAALNPAATSVTLTWTAPGDDAATGTAASYDIRYSTSPITAANFASASQVVGEPAPLAAGANQTMAISGLMADTEYHFALKTSDETLNVSGLSNVPSLKTALAATGTVTLLSPGDGEKFLSNQLIAVVWRSSLADAAGVSLSASLDGGAFTSFATGLDPALGLYYWSVPDVTADVSIAIKVTAFDAAGTILASDTADAPFVVAASEALAAAGPEGGTVATGFQPSSSSVGADVLAPEVLAALAEPSSLRKHDYDPAAERAATKTIDEDKGLVAVPDPRCEPGTSFRGTASTVYYCGVDGVRYPFPNEKTFLTWFPSFDAVKTVADAAISQIALGGYATYRPGIRLLKLITDSKTYAVARGGVLRHIPDEATAADHYGLGWKTLVDDIVEAFFSTYVIGKPIE